MNPRTPAAQPPEPSQDVDGLLRGFFRAELPDPWPAPPSVAPEPSRSRTPQPAGAWQSRQYLSLAAAIALFVAGYWTLAQCCPQASVLAPAGSADAGLHPVREGVMANQPEKLHNRMELEKGGLKLNKMVVPTPKADVQIFERLLPDNRIIMRLELIEGKNKNKHK